MNGGGRRAGLLSRLEIVEQSKNTVDMALFVVETV
jgi:hypothetical protein